MDTDLSERLGKREWAEKSFRLKWYVSLIEKLCLFDHNKFQKTVILDEGILHNNHYSFLINERGGGDFPEGLIFMEYSIENIYINLMRCKNLIGDSRIIAEIDGEQKLQEYLIADKNHTLQKMEMAKTLKIPYIVLTDKQSFDERLGRVNEFLITF